MASFRWSSSSGLRCNSACNSESTFRDVPLIPLGGGARSGQDRRMNRESHARRRVAVLGGNRIPFARSNTAYADASNQEMLTAAVDGLATRFGIEGELLGE